MFGISSRNKPGANLHDSSECPRKIPPGNSAADNSSKNSTIVLASTVSSPIFNQDGPSMSKCSLRRRITISTSLQRWIRRLFALWLYSLSDQRRAAAALSSRWAGSTNTPSLCPRSAVPARSVKGSKGTFGGAAGPSAGHPCRGVAPRPTVAAHRVSQCCSAAR